MIRSAWKRFSLSAGEWYHQFGMFFRPGITLGFCLLVGLILDGICLLAAVLLKNHLHAELAGFFTVRELLFAMASGVTASAIVSICIEGSSNYKRNTIRLITLSDYLSIISSYDTRIASILKVTEKYELSQESPSDRLPAVLQMLPEIIPVLKQAYETQTEYLSEKEVYSIKIILQNYQFIERSIQLYIETRSPAGCAAPARRPDSVPDHVWDALPREWQVQMHYKQYQDAFEQTAKWICQNRLIAFGAGIIPVGTKYLSDEISFSDINSDISEDDTPADPMDRMSASITISHICKDIDDTMHELLKIVRREPYWWKYINLQEKYRKSE